MMKQRDLLALLQEWAVPLGVAAVVFALLQLFILRRAYPAGPAGNRAIVVVTGAYQATS
jgi:hypothetical protein